VQHPIVDYSRSWKGTEEVREMDPYEMAKLLAIDYRFWNVFHSNFYTTAILPARKGKICKMQYIDFNELQDKESEFNTAISSRFRNFIWYFLYLFHRFECCFVNFISQAI
jgi:hypothetical protein